MHQSNYCFHFIFLLQKISKNVLELQIKLNILFPTEKNMLKGMHFFQSPYKKSLISFMLKPWRY